MLRKQPFPSFLQSSISGRSVGPRTPHVTGRTQQSGAGVHRSLREPRASGIEKDAVASLLGPVGCCFRNLGKTCLRMLGMLRMLAMLRWGFAPHQHCHPNAPRAVTNSLLWL